MRLDNRPSDPRALREIVNSPEVQGEMERLAKDIRKDARRLAPRRTGNLRNHIEIERYTDTETGFEGWAVGWGDQAWYGWLVENGTEDATARPHLVPAAIRHGVVGNR